MQVKYMEFESSLVDGRDASLTLVSSDGVALEESMYLSISGEYFDTILCLRIVIVMKTRNVMTCNVYKQ